MAAVTTKGEIVQFDTLVQNPETGEYELKHYVSLVLEPDNGDGNVPNLLVYDEEQNAWLAYPGVLEGDGSQNGTWSKIPVAPATPPAS